MKDTKTLLKDTREYIKNKKYDAALKLCKIILKADKNSYMGLVFLGLCLQEQGPVEQAEKAFRKAIQLDENNPLAWNGLVNFFERRDMVDDKPELLKLYLKLISIETNEKKLVEFSEKAVDLLSFGQVLEILETIYNATKNDRCTSSNRSSILLTLKGVLGKLKPVPEECFPLYEQILMDLIANRNTISVEVYSDYLTLLHKSKKIEELIRQSEEMSKKFENNTLPLLWLCKIYNELYIEENPFYKEIQTKIYDYSEILLVLEPDNAMGLFTKAIKLYENNLTESKNLLIKVTTSRPGLIHAWYFLSEINEHLNLIDDSLAAFNRAERLLNSSNYTNLILLNKMNVLQIKLLSCSMKNDDLQLAIEKYKQSDEDLKENLTKYAAKAFLKLGLIGEADQLIEFLTDLTAKTILKLEKFSLEENWREAQSLIDQNDFNVSEWHLKVADHYWSIKLYAKCRVPLIKAAQCEPYNYQIYFRLGNYYQIINDFETAKKCYEKVVRLNLNFSQGAIELSKVYRKLKKFEENIQLLENLTTGSINKTTSWAWLQLGLNYLEQEDYEKAIENLRLVIRVDKNNIHCWEALADAYVARGSYVSAQKAYEVVLELSDEQSLYSSLQVANINKTLGHFQKARDLFEVILKENPSYIPALKGLAETCICQAKTCHAERRFGTSKLHLQYALNNVVLAIKENSQFSCLWKILADCCLFLTTNLPRKYASLVVPNRICFSDQHNEDYTTLGLKEIFDLTIKCYCNAITLLNDNILLWHDLAITYFNYALNFNEDQWFENAQAAAQFCCKKNSSNAAHWNLLGNIVMQKTEPNYPLAQHCFIKALNYEKNCAIAWANLGFLYLIKNDGDLAQQAFSEGQRCDPYFVNSWIGKALWAEFSGSGKAMALFRHSIDLGGHDQGSIGYGEFVIKTVLEAPSGKDSYAIKGLHALPVAGDALTWFCEQNEDDGCAWNMLGIIQERLGLKLSALESFKKAERLTGLDAAKTNLGRLYLKVGRYQEALSTLQRVKESNFSSGSCLALALFKSKQFEESYEIYEQSLHFLAEEESKQSDLLVALASMAYMFQGPEPAKTLLFQSINLTPPSAWGLFATLSLGLLHEDLKLAKLVLKELQMFKDDQENVHHYAELQAFVHIFEGNYSKAVSSVSKLVHRHPNNANLWLTLSKLLIRLQAQRKASLGAANCAQIAMNIGKSSTDVRYVLSIVALSSLMAGETKKALIAAQKAVHCYPEVAESWAVLSFVLAQLSTKLRDFPSKILAFLSTLSSTTSTALQTWTENCLV